MIYISIYCTIAIFITLSLIFYYEYKGYSYKISDSIFLYFMLLMLWPIGFVVICIKKLRDNYYGN